VTLKLKRAMNNFGLGNVFVEPMDMSVVRQGINDLCRNPDTDLFEMLDRVRFYEELGGKLNQLGCLREFFASHILDVPPLHGPDGLKPYEEVMNDAVYLYTMRRVQLALNSNQLHPLLKRIDQLIMMHKIAERMYDDMIN